MNEIELRNRLGIFLIVSHFGILLLIIAFWLRGGFLVDEMTTSVAIIAPFFAAYTTAILRSIIDSKHRTAARGRAVTPVFAFMAFLIPSLFIALVAGAVVLKAFNVGLTSFEDFKILLGAAETIFGVYVGQLIFSLFEQQKKTPREAENKR